MPRALFGFNAGPHEWICDHDSIYHNGENGHKIPNLPCLDRLSPGQTVGLQVTSKGELNLYLDNECYFAIATGLPVDIPLCGVADVYGWCTKIKSEIMSGKHDGNNS